MFWVKITVTTGSYYYTDINGEKRNAQTPGGTKLINATMTKKKINPVPTTDESR